MEQPNISPEQARRFELLVRLNAMATDADRIWSMLRDAGQLTGPAGTILAGAMEVIVGLSEEGGQMIDPDTEDASGWTTAELERYVPLADQLFGLIDHMSVICTE